MYVELDCLLDTRMATLFQMGEEFATKAFDFGYHDRLTDLIPGIDYTEFKKQYDQRDKTVLKNAMVTPVISMIKEFSEQTRQNTINSPFHYTPKIVLNVHPYVLNEEEMKLLGNRIHKASMGLADVDVICKPLEEITPLYVKLNFSLMVVYRYDEWLEIHCLNKLFEKTIAPEVTMIGPSVYFKKPEVIPKEGENPFKDMEEQASVLIGLQLRPVSLFSLVVKPVKKT